MIEFDNVFKSYQTNKGEKIILDGVNLKLPTDKSVGILGRNGAGKSTLMRMIAGVEAPNYGEIRCAKKISPPIGFGGLLHAQLTGEANARFAARYHGLDPDMIVAFCQQFTRLGDYFYMPVRTYSSGMRAKMAFALSTAIDFELYLVDEVLAVGDANFRRRCKRLFEERADRSSMIIVSHQIQTIRQFCDSAAVLHNAQLWYFNDIEAAREFYESKSR